MKLLNLVRKWIQRNSPYVMFVWGAWIVSISLGIRLSNPALTETQLLITFWPVWFLIGIVSVVLFLLVDDR